MEQHDTMNMSVVNINTFRELIKEQLEDGDLKPVLGIGKAGIGKTESIAGLCKELGIGFRELRLVTMNETDLLGIPDYVDRVAEDGTKYRTTTFASNDMLPIASRDGERGILCLDELTSASKTIRAAAYQLLEEKRALGNYKLPNNWLVVALGNGPEDGGVFQGMEHTITSRCRCYYVEPELDAWKRWAVNHGVNATVIAFVSFEPEYLHKFPEDADSIQVFPSPRSWASLSRKLNDREKRGAIKDEMISIYAAAEVGMEVATKFAAFYKYNQQKIDVEAVLKGKPVGDISDMPMEAIHISVESLIKNLKEKYNTCNSSDFQLYMARVVNALIAIADVRLDAAAQGIKEIRFIAKGENQETDIVKYMLDNDSIFSKNCPKFEEFADNNADIFTD